MDRFIPKTTKIIKTDFLSTFLVFFPLITLTMYLLSYYVELFKEYPFGIPVVSGILCSALLLIRIRYIKKLMANGVVAEGKIDTVTYFVDRCWITYSFEFQNTGYKKRVLLNQTSWVKNLNVNDRVGIVIQYTNPKKAVLKDAFN